MREDHLLYIIGIICFIFAGVILAMGLTIWAVPTLALGLILVVLGYFHRPEVMETPSTVPPHTPEIPPPPSPAVIEEETEEPEEIETEAEEEAETAALFMECTEIKGIGKKREEKLESIGIYTVKQLIESSPEDLAEKLDVSPKRTRRWIEDAKKLLEEQ
ncbi:MAG: helix-hairpin-helix domain-containing protein [Thermoproteota archaeon]